jgi:hypothetical protein
MLRGRNLLGHAVFNARSLKHVVLQQLRSSASAHHLGLLSVEARPCTAPGARAWRQQSRCASTGGRAEPPAAAAAEDAAEAAAAGDAAAAAAAADDADDAAEGAADAGLTAAVSATTAAEQPPLEPALYVVVRTSSGGTPNPGGAGGHNPVCAHTRTPTRAHHTHARARRARPSATWRTPA